MPLNDPFSFTAGTHSPTTGAVTDADSTPVFDVYQGSNDTPILANQSMTKRGSATGTYRGTFTVSVANGFTVGQWVNVVTKATVGGIAAIIPDVTFRVDVTEVTAGVVPASVAGSVGSVVGNVGGTVASVVDISTTGLTESAVVPAANATPLQKLNFVATMTRNKLTQTATQQLLRNDTDSATIGTSNVSDDGTTAVRGKFA